MGRGKYLFLILFFHSLCLACKCVGVGDYDVIFEGKVVSKVSDKKNIATNFSNRYTKVTFKVLKNIKGADKFTQIVYTASVLRCGAHYELGKEYKVYATKSDVVETLYCYGREFGHRIKGLLKPNQPNP
jgi:hypothetical protein